MSHEYVKCKHCYSPVMEHLANHTEIGSLCDTCYTKSGLKEKHDKELLEQMRTCTECGKQYLKRNFKTPYPDTTCGKCGEEAIRGKEVLSKDVPFSSDENQGRNIVLGFLYRGSERIGLRVLRRSDNQVINVKTPENYQFWNLNINNGKFYPKCCKLTAFPQLRTKDPKRTPFDPHAQVSTTVSGAWVLEELDNSVFKLLSISGQEKNVAEEAAINFHKGYNIANAVIEEGRLTGTFKKPEALVDTQVYITIDEDEMFKLKFKEQPTKEQITESLHVILNDGVPVNVEHQAKPKFVSEQVSITIDAEELYKLGFKTQPNKEEITEAIHEAIAKLSDPNVLSAPKGDNSADIALMKELNAELLAACKAYYSDSNESPLSDLEYDNKFDQLLDLEHKTGVVLPDSVTQGVGVAVTGKLPKVDHKDRILSLDKTKEVGTLQGFLKQDPDGEMGVLSWKMDGLTIVATYKDGVLQQALTRGDGKTGEDVTHNAKFFKGMPRRIPYTGEIRVRGEAVMSYSTFERINANLPEGQEPYKNPRNLASGTVRRSEITRDGSIEFIPFGVVVDDPKFKPTNYLQSLRFLSGQGFNPVDHVLVTADSMNKTVEVFKSKVANFDYPTDGLVLIIDDVFVYEKLGTTGRHPKGSIAFKWADEKEKTILRSIEWSASRTGVLTPVANFDPIDLEGTTVRRASVHNLSMVRRLKLGIGDEISIYKANMIIPQIAENHTQSDTVQAPSNCPVCQEATTIRQDGEAQFVICINDECGAKNVGLLAHFAKREAMAIDGVSEKSIETLVSAGFIGKPRDFYNLKNHPEIQELPGWGKSSYSKLLYAVENSRAPKLANFIYALGIRNVGRSASDALARHFGSIEGFIRATAEEISTVDGVGSGMTADIMAYKNKHTADIEELAGLVSIINPGDATNLTTPDAPAGITQGAPNCLAGLTFCVTGKVDFPGARTALGEYIQSLGGKLSSSVTKNTDYLITNTPDSGTSKNQAAQKLGVKIIPEVGFHSLVGELSEKVLSASEPELTQGEKVVQAGIDSVVIPEDPREARIQSAEAVQALSGVPLAGLTFCVTGKVNYGTRNELFNLIESKGGSTASSITRGVDYLITNTPHSGTVKNKRALEVGARVISEAELMRMINR